MSRYKVVRELGRNQEGRRITYLATDTRLNPPQRVVIKEFRFAASGANWSGFKAYEREIEILRELEHPRIPRYLNSFETKSGFCLVQEFDILPARRCTLCGDSKHHCLGFLALRVGLRSVVANWAQRSFSPQALIPVCPTVLKALINMLSAAFRSRSAM